MADTGAAQMYTAQDSGKMIQRLFSANLDAIKKSSPRFVGDPGRLIRVAYNSIVYDEKLRTCTQASLIGGVLEAVKLGITLGGPMQEGWLIPFNTQGRMTATLIIGYQGYRNIIDRGKSVLDLHPRAVYEGDEFSVDFGTQPRIFHRPFYLTAGKVQGKLTHVYAVARLRGGGVQFEVLSKEDVDKKHRAKSRAKDSGPWVTNYDEMALKTAIRVIAKYVPKSSELLARALDLDDRADRGVDQEFDLPGEIQVFDEPKAIAAPGANVMDQLKQQLKNPAETVPVELRSDQPLSDAENAALDRELGPQDR